MRLSACRKGLAVHLLHRRPVFLRRGPVRVHRKHHIAPDRREHILIILVAGKISDEIGVVEGEDIRLIHSLHLPDGIFLKSRFPEQAADGAVSPCQRFFFPLRAKRHRQIPEIGQFKLARIFPVPAVIAIKPGGVQLRLLPEGQELPVQRILLHLIAKSPHQFNDDHPYTPCRAGAALPGPYFAYIRIHASCERTGQSRR